MVSQCFAFKRDKHNIFSRKLTWKLRIDRWKTIFLYNPVVLGFHVNLRGSIHIYIYIYVSQSMVFGFICVKV